jgi:hypothetical protein
VGVRLLLGVVLIGIASCRVPAVTAGGTDPIDLHAACALAARKCSACHERDRIDDAHKDADGWRITVDRMRHFPGSAISPRDGEVILRCLIDRGPPALADP